jgi:aminopeptidase N
MQPFKLTLFPRTAGRMLDEFEDTPKMSTYLLAFIVSEYRGRTNTASNITVFAPEGVYSQTEYSFSFTEKVLNEFNNFTAFPYQSVPEIKKLDQAAIPDFEAGAMENWGLLT